MSTRQRTIAVLSDIHIGPSARSKDLCPPPRADKLRDERFCDQFVEFVTTNNISADHLIVSGDLSSKGASDEFTHASSLVSRWAKALNVSPDEVYFVPGNHDVDWEVLSLPPDSPNAHVRWQQRYDPFLKATHELSSRMAHSTGALFDSPYAAIWNTPPLLVAGINSASHDGPGSTPHHGLAAPESLEWLERELSTLPPREGQLRIFVVHHHPLQYSDPFPDIPAFRDFSILVNAEQLQFLLRKHHFDLLVHGHKHVPRFQTILVGSDHPLHVLGAGSFSVDLDSSYSGFVTNQFHLIEVDKRLTTTGPICGTLRNWSFAAPHGWRQSDSTFSGIDHQIGFGALLTRPEAKAIITSLVDARKAGWHKIKWSELVSEDGRLRYLQPRTQMEVLEEFASEHRLEIAGAPPTDIVLFR